MSIQVSFIYRNYFRCTIHFLVGTMGQMARVMCKN